MTLGNPTYKGVPNARVIPVVNPVDLCQCGHGPAHHSKRDFVWLDCLMCDDPALCAKYAPPNKTNKDKP